MQLLNDNLDSKEGNASFALIGPGITPVYMNNPAFRVVQLDPKRQLLADYEQYYMDLILSTGKIISMITQIAFTSHQFSEKNF